METKGSYDLTAPLDLSERLMDESAAAAVALMKLGEAREALGNIRRMIEGRAKPCTQEGQIVIDGILFELILEEVKAVEDAHV
jgi:hypothetical protein